MAALHLGHLSPFPTKANDPCRGVTEWLRITLPRLEQLRRQCVFYLPQHDQPEPSSTCHSLAPRRHQSRDERWTFLSAVRSAAENACCIRSRRYCALNPDHASSSHDAAEHHLAGHMARRATSVTPRLLRPRPRLLCLCPENAPSLRSNAHVAAPALPQASTSSVTCLSLGRVVSVAGGGMDSSCGGFVSRTSCCGSTLLKPAGAFRVHTYCILYRILYSNPRAMLSSGCRRAVTHVLTRAGRETCSYCIATSKAALASSCSADRQLPRRVGRCKPSVASAEILRCCNGLELGN